MSHVTPSGDADMNQIDFLKRFNFHSDVQACGFINGTLWRGNLDYIKDYGIDYGNINREK